MTVNEAGNEKELWHRIANGDEAAFTTIVHRYWKNIYSQSLSYLKSTQSAEELTQDVFLRVWQTRDKLISIENFSGYLYVICRNALLNALRKKLKENAAIISPDLSADILQPDKQLEYREYYNSMLLLIDQLPDVRRRVFKMSRLEGKTHEEIAATLNIHKDTVAQYIVKALNYLRIQLNKSGNDHLLIALLLGISQT